MNNAKAIFKKQVISFFKKPTAVGTPISFLMFAAVFTFVTADAGDAISNLFATIFVGMGMVGNTASFIIEDRVTMNLRFMSMAGVKSWEYLLGTGGAMFLSSIVFLFVFALIGGNFAPRDLGVFMALTMLASMKAILLGSTLGLLKNMWLFQPISMLVGFAPMLAELNENLEGAFNFLFTQQLNLVLREGYIYMEDYGYVYFEAPDALMIIGANLVIITLVFIFMAYRGGLYRDGVQSTPSK